MIVGDKETHVSTDIATLLAEWEDSDRRGGNVAECLERFEIVNDIGYNYYYASRFVFGGE